MENVAFFNPHRRKIIFKTYTQQSQDISKTSKTKIETNRTIWYLGHTDFEIFRNFVSLRLSKIIFVQDDSIIFLVLFEAFW